MPTTFTRLQPQLSAESLLILQQLLRCVSIGKVCMIMPAPATQKSTCLGHLRLSDTDKIFSFSYCIAQGGQGKYCFMSLLPTVSLINFANVNNPIEGIMSMISGFKDGPGIQ